MNSRIEQKIMEIEEYVDNCKTQPLSNTKIIVNREEIMELLTELSHSIPSEVKQCQKILTNQESILAEARSQANQMIEEANRMTLQLVDEHEIMQKAYNSAHQVVDNANVQAQDIIDRATNEASNIREASIRYTDEMLRSLQTIIAHSMDGAQNKFDQFISSMQSSLDTVADNRNELSGNMENENNNVES